MTVSNPTEALADYPHAAIRDAFCGISDYSYDPEPAGLRAARKEISRFYGDLGIAVDPSDLVLTASTSEAYALLFKLLCDPGDEVLVPTPSYPLFDFLARAESLRTVPYTLDYDGAWFLDFNSLSGSLTKRSKAIVVVNPNNPTGSFLKHAEWQRLAAIAHENEIAIVADEVFLEYEFGTHPGRLQTLIGQNEVLSFSLGGLSKSAGMPQLKLAWIVINGRLGERQEARRRLELLADTYLSVNTPVQRALGQLLKTGREVRNALQEQAGRNLAAARALLPGSAVHLLHVEGGWSAIFQLPGTRADEEWLVRLLDQENVLLQPGYFYDMTGGAFGVASLISDPATFKEGVEGLVRLAAGF